MLQMGQKVDIKNHVIILRTRDENSDDVQLVLRMGQSSLQWGEPLSPRYELDRGLLDDVRHGDEQPVDLTIEGKFTFGVSRGAENKTIHEIIRGKDRGNNQNTHGKVTMVGIMEPWLVANGCPPYAISVEVHNNPNILCPNSSAYGEAHLFRYFRCENPQVNFDTGMVNLSGKCNVTQPIERRVAGGSNGGEFGYTDVVNAVCLTGWINDPRSVAAGQTDYNG